MALVAGVVFVASVVGALTQSRADARLAAVNATSTAPTTVVSAPPTTVAPRPGIPGFSGIEYVSIPDGGQPVTKCALLAESPQQQADGLMRQPDLGGYDAMVFRFPGDTDARFYMANVLFPLTVAFYSSDGAFIDAQSMPICLSAPEDCPTYGPPRLYRWAFEVPEGELTAAGLGPGTIVTLGGPCT